MCHHYFFKKAICSRHDIAEICSLSVTTSTNSQPGTFGRNRWLIHGINDVDSTWKMD
jgi:hypothetical protein